MGLTRLTALDTAFLHQEIGCSHMTVGGLATFDGPPPTIEEFRAHAMRRLHLLPRYRQRMMDSPGGATRPLWVDDEHFDVSYHARHAALTGEGSMQDLCDLNAEIHAHRLDRNRPLWELYLVEGYDNGNGFAVIARNHHALMDGVSNMDALGILWDLEPHPGLTERDSDEPFQPEREPGALGHLEHGARELAAGAGAIAGEAVSALRDPGQALRRLRKAAEGVGEVGRALSTPAPATPFNGEIGPGRRFTALRLDLAEVKAVKNALGGTVNDVMLTIVAEGIAAIYRERGLEPAGVELRPIVPVSIRTDSEKDTLGNRVVTLRPALPIGIEDPVERLTAINRELERCKRSTQPTVVEVLESVMNWVPAPALGPIARLAYHPRLFNVLISNIPGPQFPLYLLGRKAETMFAGGFLAPGHALAVAAVSYDGGLGFGLIADPSVVPELDAVRENIDECFTALKHAAGGSANGRASITQAPAPAAAPRGKD